MRVGIEEEFVNRVLERTWFTALATLHEVGFVVTPLGRRAWFALLFEVIEKQGPLVRTCLPPQAFVAGRRKWAGPAEPFATDMLIFLRYTTVIFL